jgi:hypothetical protein
MRLYVNLCSIKQHLVKTRVTKETYTLNDGFGRDVITRKDEIP